MILEELIRKKVSTDFWQPHRGRWFKKKKKKKNSNQALSSKDL